MRSRVSETLAWLLSAEEDLRRTLCGTRTYDTVACIADLQGEMLRALSQADSAAVARGTSAALLRLKRLGALNIAQATAPLIAACLARSPAASSRAGVVLTSIASSAPHQIVVAFGQGLRLALDQLTGSEHLGELLREEWRFTDLREILRGPLAEAGLLEAAVDEALLLLCGAGAGGVHSGPCADRGVATCLAELSLGLLAELDGVPRQVLPHLGQFRREVVAPLLQEPSIAGSLALPHSGVLVVLVTLEMLSGGQARGPDARASARDSPDSASRRAAEFSAALEPLSAAARDPAALRRALVRWSPLPEPRERPCGAASAELARADAASDATIAAAPELPAARLWRKLVVAPVAGAQVELRTLGGGTVSAAFTPVCIRADTCMARTWARGTGGQCGRWRSKGSDFCCIHVKDEAWRAHGRVDGDIPVEMLELFRQRRASLARREMQGAAELGPPEDPAHLARQHDMQPACQDEVAAPTADMKRKSPELADVGPASKLRHASSGGLRAGGTASVARRGGA